MISKDRKTDKIIRRSLKNIEVPKEIFEEAYEKLGLKEEYQKVQKNKQQIKFAKQVLEYAACIVLIVIVSFSTFVLVRRQNCTAKNNNYIDKPILEAGELPVATVVINELEDSEKKNFFVSPIGKKDLVEESDYIAIVKLKKIKKYFNYSKEANRYYDTPLTLAEYEVVENYKGILSGIVDIVTYGGVITLSEYEKACPTSIAKKLRLDKISNEEKRKTFVEVYNNNTKYIPKLEKDKYYLIYFKYNNEIEEYKIVDSAVYEYNIEDSTILNTETYQWDSFEFIN